MQLSYRQLLDQRRQVICPQIVGNMRIATKMIGCGHVQAEQGHIAEGQYIEQTGHQVPPMKLSIHLANQNVKKTTMQCCQVSFVQSEAVDV